VITIIKNVGPYALNGKEHFQKMLGSWYYWKVDGSGMLLPSFLPVLAIVCGLTYIYVLRKRRLCRNS